MSWEIAIVLSLGIMSLTLIYLSTTIKGDKFFPLALLFLLSGLFIMPVEMDVAIKLAQINNQTAQLIPDQRADIVTSLSGVYTLSIFLIILTIAIYLIIHFLWGATRKIPGSIGKKEV